MKLKTILKENENIIEGIYDYKINNNTIIYFEDNLKVTIVITDDIKIIRENDEYILEMLFKDSQTTNNKFILKENNYALDLPITTKKLQINKDKIEIEYEVNDLKNKFTVYILYLKNVDMIMILG